MASKRTNISETAFDQEIADTIQEVRTKILKQRSWLCLICKGSTKTVPAMLGHLRIKHRRRAMDCGSGYLVATGKTKRYRLAVCVYSDSFKTWHENVAREWNEAHSRKSESR